MNTLTKIICKRREWITNKTKGFLSAKEIFGYITTVKIVYFLRINDKLPSPVFTIRLIKFSHR